MILEVGKRYVMRNGDESGTLESSGCSDYPFIGEAGFTWQSSGEYLPGGGPFMWDIVAGYRPMPLAIVGFRRP